MAFNTAIQKVVKKIAQVPGIGVSATFRKVAAGTYNIGSGESNETFTDSTVKGVFSDIELREVTDLIQGDDRKFTIPASYLTTAPSVSDRVKVGSTDYQIITIKTVDQAGIDISYELILRR